MIVGRTLGRVLGIGLAMNRARVLRFDQAGFGDWIVAVIDALGLAPQFRFGLLESFRFTAAGLINRTLGFTPFRFPVVLLDHGRQDNDPAD